MLVYVHPYVRLCMCTCSMEAIHIKGKAVTLNAILHYMQNHCALFSNHSALFSQLGEIEHC